jgi:hypothetical protein
MEVESSVVIPPLLVVTNLRLYPFPTVPAAVDQARAASLLEIGAHALRTGRWGIVVVERGVVSQGPYALLVSTATQ